MKMRVRYYMHLGEHPEAAAVIAANDFEDQVEVIAGDDTDHETTCTVTWYKVGGRLRPRVEVFDEDWLTFATASDVFAAMAARQNSAIQPDEFCRMLDGLGYKNITNAE